MENYKISKCLNSFTRTYLCLKAVRGYHCLHCDSLEAGQIDGHCRYKINFKNAQIICTNKQE